MTRQIKQGNWRLYLLAFVLGVCWFGLARADVPTHALPDQTRQRQVWAGDAMNSFVRSGCLPAVPAGLTFVAFACEAYVRDTTTGELLYVAQPAKAVGPLSSGDGTYWLALSRDLKTSHSGWTRQTGTSYLWRQLSGAPTVLTGVQVLASVTVAGGVITAVLDTRVSASEARTGWADPADPLYGAAGNAVTNDAPALAALIATGKPIDFKARTYAVATKLTFNQPNARYWGQGARLLYTGPNTSRLADISANNILFEGLIFDGNGAQPMASLLYVLSNTADLQFVRCTFTHLTGTAYGSNVLNGMYALIISPYGVTHFQFLGCVFADLLKYNNGAYAAQTSGYGFVGGIFFMLLSGATGNNFDLAGLTAAQPVPTSGVIDDCYFDNIQTVLAAGLTTNQVDSYDDADGIRFYGDDTLVGAIRLPVKITNSTFNKVSKRAVKGSIARGMHLENLHIFGAGTQYGMTSLFKADNETFVKNVRYWGSPTNRVNVAVNVQGNAHVEIDGVFVDYCRVAVSINNAYTAVAMGNIKVRNLYFANCSEGGYFVVQNPIALGSSDLLIENAFFGITGNTATGLQANAATDGTLGLVLRNVEIVNGDVKLSGSENVIDDVRIRITSSGYTGTSTTRALFEIGDAGAGVGKNTIRNLFVDAMGIDTAYITALRPYLGYIAHPRLDVTNVRIIVPETMQVTYPHLELGGNMFTLDGLTYMGPGRVQFGTVFPMAQGHLSRLTRLGTGATGDYFLYTANVLTVDVVLQNVVDLRPTTSPSIRFNSTGRFVVRDVTSTSSNATIVQGMTAAKATNVQRVLVPHLANLGTPEDGVQEYCDDCLYTSNPCTAASTGAWAKRIAGTWRCD